MKKLITLLFLFAFFSKRVKAQSSKDSLFVFVGEKIDFKSVPLKESNPADTFVASDGVTRHRKTIPFDNKFYAKYKILKSLHGSFSKNTIDFFAFSHNVPLRFPNFRYVLLYLIKDGETFYQVKYKYSQVYKARNGRFAVGYPNTGINIKPHRIRFKNKIPYNVIGESLQNVLKKYPPPYYKIKGNKIKIVLGNYVEELFE